MIPPQGTNKFFDHREDYKTDEFIRFGEDNLFPQNTIELYNKSSINASAINAIVEGIIGKGLTADNEAYLEFHNFTKNHMKAKTKKRYYYCTYGYDNVVEHVMSEGEIPLRKRENYERYTLESMIEWWRPKAQRRYEKLVEEDRLRHDMEIYTTESINSDERIDMVR